MAFEQRALEGVLPKWVCIDGRLRFVRYWRSYKQFTVRIAGIKVKEQQFLRRQ
jgi:hypothetical protein